MKLLIKRAFKKFTLVYLMLSVFLCNSQVIINATTIGNTETSLATTNINGNNDIQENKTIEGSDSVMLFELDQGIGGQELVGYYKGKPDAYENALNNIDAAIAPLKQGYQVAVLIFPQHEYKLGGWGKRDGELDRFSPELLHAIDFFQSKGTKLYLEIYTSGIYTNQNGELGTLPVPPLYASNPSQTVKGMSLDLESVVALKNAYPNTFAGVRINELIGTDEIGENNDPHGFLVNFNAIKAIVDTCNSNNLEMIWSDHSWTLRDYKPGKTILWQDAIDYATNILKKKISLMWANNNSGLWVALGQTPAVQSLMERNDINFGMSVQSWFWGAQYATPLAVSNYTSKWYKMIEDGTPIEILAAYTQYAVEKGAHIVHFEPSWYFFNFHQSPWLVEQRKNDPFANLDVGYRGMYEEKPDYSARLALKRLIQILLDPQNPNNPPKNPSDYYGGMINEDQYFKNLSDDSYERFQQTTITILNQSQYRQHFDIYNVNESWQRNDKYRFSDYLFIGKTLFAGRINLRVDMQDEIYILKESNGKKVMEFYTQMSGLMGTEELAFNDNENGKVVGITAMNLKRELINSLANDTDELLIARQKSDDSPVTFEIYSISSGLRADYLEFSVKRMFIQTETELLKQFGLDIGISGDEFVSIHGVRENYSVNSNTLLSYSNLLLISQKNNRAYATYNRYGKKIVQDLGNYQKGKMLFTTADVDNKYDDELVSLCWDGNNGLITNYSLTETQIQKTTSKNTDIKDTPIALYSLKKGSYSNAATNLISPETKTEGANLALNRPVTTNNYTVGWGSVPQNAVDGKITTWTQTIDKSILPQLTIDLGSNIDINRVVVYVAQWNYVQGYKISISIDGNNFTQVAAESNQIPYAKFIQDFLTQKARYVRFEATNIQGVNATICEIQVFNAVSKGFATTNNNLALNIVPEIKIGTEILTEENQSTLLQLGGNYNNFVTAKTVMTDGIQPGSWSKGNAWFYADPNNAAEVNCDITITLNLGEQMIIGGYSLYSGTVGEQWEIDNKTGFANQYKSKAIHDWTFEVSVDGQTWVTKDTVTNNTNLLLDKADISEVECRYVRFHITKGTKKETPDSSTWNIMGISELKVMRIKTFNVPFSQGITPPARNAKNLLAGRTPDCYIDGVKLTTENEVSLLDLGPLTSTKGSLSVISDGITNPGDDNDGADAWHSLYRDSDITPGIDKIECDINFVWDLGKELNINGYALWSSANWKDILANNANTSEAIKQNYKASANTNFSVFTSIDGVSWALADVVTNNDKLVYKKDLAAASKGRFIRLHISIGPKTRIPYNEYKALVGGFWKTVKVVEFEAYPSLDINDYNVSTDNIITNIQPNIKVSDIYNGVFLRSETTLQFKKAYGLLPLRDTDTIGTGTTVDVIVNGEIVDYYTIVIYGDLDGDGIISLDDLVSMRNSLLEEPIDEPFKSAGDFYDEGNITLNDLVGMMAYISESGNINQNH